MTPFEISDLINKIDCAEVYIVCRVADLETVEEELNKIKDLGYAAFLRTTAMGNEIVVTEKVGE
jgi:hypothetical protein